MVENFETFSHPFFTFLYQNFIVLDVVFFSFGRLIFNCQILLDNERRYPNKLGDHDRIVGFLCRGRAMLSVEPM